MSPFKSLFILYLIISSFALTVSSNIQKEEKGKYQLIDIPDDVLEKMKKSWNRYRCGISNKFYIWWHR